MWQITTTDDYIKSHRWYEKKRPRQLCAVLDNLDTFLRALNENGMKLEQVRTLGFIHSEPRGVLAIDQKGGGDGTKIAQTRLYIFANAKTEVIHLLRIGDKESQKEDITISCNLVQMLLQKQEAITNEP